jgi:CheY-like chemotaxis protein
VDDQTENRILLVTSLALLGFEVREANDGEEALEIWTSWKPNLIWMDMRMPKVDGYEATRTIRQAENSRNSDVGPSVPAGHCIIIALTASAFDHDQAAILAAGCDDFVFKPFRETTILEKLTQHLRVQFRYEEEIPKAAPGIAAMHDRVQALPASWIRELNHASTIGDDQAALEIVERISQTDAGLGTELRHMVHQFRFEALAGLLKESFR